MKRTILVLGICALLSLHAKAQVTISTNGSQADASAMLDIKSTDKGLLIPRVTTAQRNNIALPATGLLVFQTDAPEGFYYNKGTTTQPQWILLGATGPAGPQGVPGPSGIIQSYYVAGTSAYPSATQDFISPTITITITAGQKVHLVASRAVGGYAAVHNLSIHPAYQSVTPGSPIVDLGLGIDNLEVPAKTRTTISINGLFENLPAGTYKFGMSGITQGDVWMNSEWGYVTALVF
jgi:hypothetical protein